MLADQGVIGRIGVMGGGAQPQAVLGRPFDAIQPQAADVDQATGLGHAGLHQVQHIGATGDELRTGNTRLLRHMTQRLSGATRIAGRYQRKRVHAGTLPTIVGHWGSRACSIPATSHTAEVIWV